MFNADSSSASGRALGITRPWLAKDQEETPQVLADKYGESAERIRQIEVKAMKQMRKVIEN